MSEPEQLLPTTEAGQSCPVETPGSGEIVPGIPNFVPRKDPAVTARFFAALGNEQRWEMVRKLADGRAMSATHMAKALKRDADMVSKHLRVLGRAGLVRSQRGDDERMKLFYIPAENRLEPGVLVWGIVRVDLRP